MRADPAGVEPRRQRNLLQHQAQGLARQVPRRPARGEEIAAGLALFLGPRGQGQIPGAFGNRHQPFPPALAAHRNQGRAGAERRRRQADQFRNTEPAAIEHFDHRCRHRPPFARQGGGGGDQRLHLLLPQRLGQALRQAGRFQQFRGVIGAHPLPQQELMKLTEGGKPPCLGARRQALCREARQPGAKQGAIRPMQRRRMGGGETREILKVRLIGGERIARRAAFGGQHFQKCLGMAGKPRPGSLFTARGSGHWGWCAPPPGASRSAERRQSGSGPRRKGQAPRQQPAESGYGTCW